MVEKRRGMPVAKLLSGLALALPTEEPLDAVEVAERLLDHGRVP
jgi:hypothetical protein